jgi:hypothetical protein
VINRYPYDHLDECCRQARNLLLICVEQARFIDDPQAQQIAALYGRIAVKPADDKEDQLIVVDNDSGVYNRLDMHSLILYQDPIYACVVVLRKLCETIVYHTGLL